jgi:hypothetical protein
MTLSIFHESPKVPENLLKNPQISFQSPFQPSNSIFVTGKKSQHKASLRRELELALYVLFIFSHRVSQGKKGMENRKWKFKG